MHGSEQTHLSYLKEYTRRSTLILVPVITPITMTLKSTQIGGHAKLVQIMNMVIAPLH